MVGFVFVLGFPLAIASGLWSALVVGLALVIGPATARSPFENPGAESLRFGFPVLVAFFLTLALLLRAFFPKNLVAARRDRNRAAAAQQALSSMVLMYDNPSARRLYKGKGAVPPRIAQLRESGKLNARKRP